MPSSRRFGRLLLVASTAASVMIVPLTGRAQPGPVTSVTSSTNRPASVAPQLSAIGAGDKVLLRVWREPTWSDSLLVGPDGDLVLPRIGRYHAAGMDQVALRDTIQRRLATYLRDPSVDIVVLRRVAVLGAVRKPDVYYVDAVSTLR